MKLKESFVTYSDDKDYVMMDFSQKFSGVVHGNESAGFIIECLKEDTSIDDIVKKMREEYDVSEEVVRKATEKIIAKLRSIDALDE